LKRKSNQDKIVKEIFLSDDTLIKIEYKLNKQLSIIRVELKRKGFVKNIYFYMISEENL
jgi:hypothetical protein